LINNNNKVKVNIIEFNCFCFISQGIYKGEDFGDPRRETHSVLVVGYGILDGEDFWLIKNSHGPDWGMSGYGRILRNSGLRYGICGILKKPAYPVIKSII
jgi:C1A family cysteine protease